MACWRVPEAQFSSIRNEGLQCQPAVQNFGGGVRFLYVLSCSLPDEAWVGRSWAVAK